MISEAVPVILASLGVQPEWNLSINNATQVITFIQRQDIAVLIHKAVTLVRELFPELRTILLEVSSDPEESAEWIVLRVTSAAPRTTLTSAYRQYIQRWVRETPADKRHLIRLSYTSG